jgi:uncharacterized membrane protein YfcA
LIYAVLGVLFGVAGGMGLGGGIVLIPALTLMMGLEQHAAQGMTLFAYLPMAVFALISHIRQKIVRIRPTLYITAFGLAGAVGGYLLAVAIETQTLKTVFGAFLIAAALLRAWRQEIGPWLQRRKEEKGN